MELEKQFREKCKQCLPKYIMVDGVKYKIDAYMTAGGRYHIHYGGFDGEYFDWKNNLFDFTFEICDVIPEKCEYKKGELRDATIYKLSMDDIITECLAELKKYSYAITQRKPIDSSMG